MRHWITALLTVATLMSGCANRMAAPPGKPIIRRIAIIPASNPTWYTVENAPPIAVAATGGLGDLGYKLSSKGKAKAFNKAFLSQPSTLGTDFTSEVASALRANGFTVAILEGVKRSADDPDDVDYQGISSDADAILNLWISEVGLYSSMRSRDYVPRLNAFGKLVVKGRKSSIYEDEIDYGVDAKKGSESGIVADPKFAYSSFEAVMSHIEEIRTAFHIGTADQRAPLEADRQFAQLFEGRHGIEVAVSGYLEVKREMRITEWDPQWLATSKRGPTSNEDFLKSPRSTSATSAQPAH